MTARAAVVLDVHAPSVGAQLRAHRDVRRHLWIPVGVEPFDARPSLPQGEEAGSAGRTLTGHVVLDIGSNDGTLLSAYTTSALRRVGIDPTAARFADYYPPDARIVPTFFSASTFREVIDAPARIITSIAMYYDLEDPVAFARDVAECLDPAGVWHFEQSYLPSMLRSTAYDTVCHEHIEYYSLATIRHILAEADLELVDVRFNRINGGSFAVTAARVGSRFVPSRVLIDWFVAQEQRMALDTPGPFRRFEEKVFKHRADLTELITTLHRGRSIMGLGASTKGNVLLQFCGFSAEYIEAIGEVNEDKFGHVTPGTGIPIVPEAEMRARRPDYLLVFPWHFRDAVIEQETDTSRAAVVSSFHYRRSRSSGPRRDLRHGRRRVSLSCRPQLSANRAAASSPSSAPGYS